MSKVISLFKRTNNSQEQFQALVGPYMDLLFGQAYKYTGSRHGAEDLVQDLLIEIYQKQDKLAQVDSPKAWLMRCLYNRFVDSYRKLKAQPRFEDLEESQTAHSLPNQDSPEANYLHRQIVAGLELLSADQRMVISLHDIEGYTLVELSEIMAMPVGTLKSHLHRGRKQLQKKLKLQPYDTAVRY